MRGADDGACTNITKLGSTYGIELSSEGMKEVRTMNTQSERALTSDAFFAGLLAGLASIGQRTLTGTRSDMHRAFYNAVSQCTKTLDLSSLQIDYDPLYGVSPWFDRALTRAQRDLLVNFPNPSYERIEICYDDDEAKEVLSETPFGEQLVALANALAKELSAKR